MMECGIFGSYYLQYFNSEPSPDKVALTLSKENENIIALVKSANTLRGPVKVADGTLSGVLVSTVVGSDDEIKIEDTIKSGFEAGFAFSACANTLTLSSGDDIFVFERALATDVLLGEYLLTSFNGCSIPLYEDKRLTIVSSVPGNVCIIAQFTNSIRGELSFDGLMLQGVTAMTMDAVDDVTKTMEECFASGMKHGMKVTLDNENLTLTCSGSTFVYAVSLQAKTLVGEYVLNTLNGVPTHTKSNFRIILGFDKDDSGRGLMLRTVVANTLWGNIKIICDTLKGEIASTRMRGMPKDMCLEEALCQGFESGFSCTIDGECLTLKDDKNVLVLTKMPTFQYKNGKPMYKGSSVSKCFKERDNGLLFRIINQYEGKWAFYNDTVDYNMYVKVVFGAQSKIVALGNTQITATEEDKLVAEVTVGPGATEMFIMGHVNGYASSYDALPI